MAFALGAAQIPSLGDWLSPRLSPRVNQAYSNLNVRSNATTGNNTVNMFIDAQASDYEWAASIVTAYADQTVYALQCTAPTFVGSETCGPNADILTITSGPSLYEVSTVIVTQTRGSEVSIYGKETCALAGTTEAVCTGTVSATVGDTMTSTIATVTLSGSDNYYRFNVEITGGAEKTVNATATAPATASATAISHQGAAMGLDVKNVVFWALAAVIGVSSIQIL